MISQYFKKEFLEQLLKTKISSSNAKGVDKISATIALEKKLLNFELISRKIRTKKFKFSPYLELLKVKKRDKYPRMLSIPTVRDRIVLLALKEYLHSIFSDSINKKLPNSYISDIKKYLVSNKASDVFFIKTDIENFYDKINQEKLLEILKGKKLSNYIISIVSDAIKNPTVPVGYRKDQIGNYISTIGVPQGLAISNILAQVYLTDIDSCFNKKSVLYLRYVDDILILMNINKVKQYEKNLYRLLNLHGLNVNVGKTYSGSLNDFVTFLGYNFSKNIISVSEKNIESLIQRIAAKATWLKKVISTPAHRPNWIKTEERIVEIFLEEINEKITGAKSKSKNYGWLFYFIELDDKNLLFRLDKIIEKIVLDTKIFLVRPNELKRLVRAFYEIKHNKGGSYVMDYDQIDSVNKKRSFLIRRGKLDPSQFYTDLQIDSAFEKYRIKSLKDLEEEVGYRYF